MNLYDNQDFFDAYAQMHRSQHGLEGAGEWHQLQPLFPELRGKTVLDLGCGYGWHCKYAAEQGAKSVLGIDQSEKMIAEAEKRNAVCRNMRIRRKPMILWYPIWFFTTSKIWTESTEMFTGH